MSQWSVLILSRSMQGRELLSSAKTQNIDFAMEVHTLTFNPQAESHVVFPHIENRVNHINHSGVILLCDSLDHLEEILKKLTQQENIRAITGLNQAMVFALAKCENVSMDAAIKLLQKEAVSDIKTFPATAN